MAIRNTTSKFIDEEFQEKSGSQPELFKMGKATGIYGADARRQLAQASKFYGDLNSGPNDGWGGAYIENTPAMITKTRESENPFYKDPSIPTPAPTIPQPTNPGGFIGNQPPTGNFLGQQMPAFQMPWPGGGAPTPQPYTFGNHNFMQGGGK